VGNDLSGHLREAGDQSDGNGPWPAEIPSAAERGHDDVVVESGGGALIRAVDPQPGPQAPVFQFAKHALLGQFIAERGQMPFRVIQARRVIGYDDTSPASATARSLRPPGMDWESRRAAPAASWALWSVCSGRPQ
jgi:hypothetical protein